MAAPGEDRPRTIPDVVAAARDRFGTLEGLVDRTADGRDLRLTFAELVDHVERSARAVIAAGLAPGDRAAVWAPNIGEWITAALGIHAAGGVLVPINTRFKGPEASYVLERSGARVLFTVTDFLDTDYVAELGDAIGRLQSLEQVIVLRGAVPDACSSYNDFIVGGESVEGEAVTARSAALGPDDLCNVLFTSGTTGKPKGVMLTHGATVRSYSSWVDVIGLEMGDRYLVINPFFHSFGLNAGILAALLVGATIVPHPIFDVPSVMRRVVEERITMLPGPPAIYQTILNHPDLDRFDLSSLRLSVTGAAPVPVEMIHRMRDRLGFEKIVTGYGLTESTGIATMCRHTDPPEIISTTSGRAIPDVEVRIVDDDGYELPRGEPGEIVIRGYNVMRGYLDDPAATAETIDGEGWLHSGDIGVMDDQGNIDVTDRKKDMFIVGGFNAYPAEIENQMASHPDIAAVAVVGVPDERLGEVGVAFVVPATGSTPDPDDLISWCRGQMANYKVPRRIELVDALPLNAGGNKVFKDELRARATS